MCILLGSVGALQASTSFTFNSVGAGVNDGGEDISPYTGTLGSSSVELFCDDFNDHVAVGNNYQANVNYTNNATQTTQTASGARYSQSDYYNTSMPSGTTLYEEMAWLFTQMEKAGQTSANDVGIQEAVWHMTSTSTSQPATAVSGGTYSGATFDSDANTVAAATADYTAGKSLTYAQWITLAQADYSLVNSAFLTPNYGGWMIITDATVYSGGHDGNTSGYGYQEFLAYNTSSGVPLASSPEPATFGLIGGALLFGAMFAKRRKAEKN
jgi:hypothetical protein